jgi:hypothetical protein
MSFKIVRLTVGKGKTVGDEKAGQWVKRYYQLELEISDEHDIEIAKASVEGLIDGWLTPSQLTSQAQAQTETQTYDMSKIKWEEKTGAKGPFQKTDDYNSLDYKALLRDLLSHNGKMRKHGYFLWIFQNGSTIGRKRK